MPLRNGMSKVANVYEDKAWDTVATQYLCIYCVHRTCVYTVINQILMPAHMSKAILFLYSFCLMMISDRYNNNNNNNNNVITKPIYTW